ncbi:MAG TPA: hypothetical protein VM121_01975 [Acidimicrobiales bacterium]|nr:hypothetical protein [Acidimicrobiales bacterium]
MSNWLVEKRLSVAAERLKRLRGELQVVDEQLASLADSADELRIRSLVSETPLADREHQDAQKHADAMARHRADVLKSISDLEKSRDQLLDQLLAEQR